MDIDDEQHDTRSPLILQHDNENHQSIGTMIIWVINGMQPLIRLFFIICCPQRMWQRILLKLNRKYSNRCLILLFIILLAIALIFMNLSLKSLTQPLKSSRDSYIIYKCKNINGSKPNDHSSRLNEVPDSQKMTVEPKVLVLTDTQHSKLGQSILEVLVANRIQYKTQVIGKSLPILTNLARAKYGAIVFENAERYLAMDQWNRELLDKYLIKYKVGMIGFFPTFSKVTIQKLRGLPLFVQELSSVVNVTLNAGNPVLRLTKAGEMLSSAPNSNWTGFISSHPSYMPLEWGLSPNSDGTYAKKCLAMLDSGTIDGVERIFFGAGLEFWLHRLLFLDAISYLSRGRLSVSLERYVLVDIDDIFVAPRGNKMVPDDVEALVAAQKRIKKVIPGFKFNLGFSGKYFRKGNPQEQLGDEHLLNFVPEFQWFGHMWRHIQPHLIVSVSKLFDSMRMNKDFAEKHGIPTDSGYSVAPHHSGVYPIHEPLYDAWKKVWNVRVTSTEEYPHLRPSRLRRGFIHRNIMVLPRQTCGLYTHTNFLNSYPGGPENFYSSVLGGEFFQTVVFNPISVFMTHQSNYALDRLGLYAFESVFEFIRCWTNVKISTAPPLQLAEMYFEMFPEEANPIWGNPCLDKRHMSIWATNKTCDRLPKILIVGPQKTGTTALYSFLSMHPSIRSNEPSPETYEEIQFFNGKNYFRGIDWYMNFFPFVSNSSLNLFEKSATYFDGELVPKRVKALLPKAHMIVIVIRPEKRAYSWYHHMRAHNDRAASAYSFYDVITADANSPKALRDLRNRCLNPGLYAKNLERWLLYFPASQIEIIDGEELRSDPVKIMTDLQTSLALSPTFDYSEHLQFNRRKGFYCQVTKGEKTKCLGRGKGRQYPVMEAREEKILKDFYKQQNVAFEKLLLKMNRPVPSWLSQELQ